MLCQKGFFCGWGGSTVGRTTSSCEASCRSLCWPAVCQSAYLRTCLREDAELSSDLEEPCDAPALPAISALQAGLIVSVHPCRCMPAGFSIVVRLPCKAPAAALMGICLF